MIRSNKKITLSVFIYLFIILSGSAQQNLLDYDNSLKFARYLKATRQYPFASEEFERLNFLWPNDSSITLELVQTYRLNSQCDKLDVSFETLQKNIFEYNSLSSAKEYLKFVLSCKSESKKFFEISSLLQPNERCFYELGYFWVNQKYDSAFDYCQKNEDALKANNKDLFQLTYNFEYEKYKSPALALIMSAVVPGSGKAYSKRFGDAFVSFLFVSTNAFASYRAFNKRGIKSVNGWIFGGLAFSFYTANLWGSEKAAKRYNSDLRKKYQNNAENIIYTSF